MVRIKRVDIYPENGPLEKGRALAKRLKAQSEREQGQEEKAEVYDPRNPAHNPPFFSWEADFSLRRSRPTRSGQAGVKPGAQKRAASAEVALSPEQAGSKTKKQKVSSKGGSNVKASTSKKKSTSALPTVPPQSSGSRSTSKGPTSSNSRSSASSRPPTVTKGNPNQKGQRGIFLKTIFYAEPTATLMRGEVWTEEDDFLLLHLKTNTKLTFPILPRYLHPHTQGACQNRYQKIKPQFDALEGEDKEAAMRERERVGSKFEEGAWDYRIPLFEEAKAQRRVAAEVKANVDLVGAACVKETAEAKGKCRSRSKVTSKSNVQVKQGKGGRGVR